MRFLHGRFEISTASLNHPIEPQNLNGVFVLGGKGFVQGFENQSLVLPLRVILQARDCDGKSLQVADNQRCPRPPSDHISHQRSLSNVVPVPPGPNEAARECQRKQTPKTKTLIDFPLERFPNPRGFQGFGRPVALYRLFSPRQTFAIARSPFPMLFLVIQIHRRRTWS